MGWIESDKVRDFITKYYHYEIGAQETDAKKNTDRTKYFPEKKT